MAHKGRATSIKNVSSAVSKRSNFCLPLILLFSSCLFAAELKVVSGPLVVSESWPESTDLVSWTRDVIRLEKAENASETAQAKAFFKWLRLFSKMATGGMLQAYEGTYGKERYVLDAHKNLFVYGWGYCDTHSRIAEAAWREYKKDPGSAERVCVQHADGGYHTMYRLKLDGRFGAFDARYGYYLVDQDAADASMAAKPVALWPVSARGPPRPRGGRTAVHTRGQHDRHGGP
jgi:hypothetical protein